MAENGSSKQSHDQSVANGTGVGNNRHVWERPSLRRLGAADAQAGAVGMNTDGSMTKVAVS